MKKRAALADTLPSGKRRLQSGFDVPGMFFAVGFAAGQRRGIEAAGLVAPRHRRVRRVLIAGAIAKRELRRHVVEGLSAATTFGGAIAGS